MPATHADRTMHRPARRRLLAALCLLPWCGPLMAADWQAVVQLTCSGGMLAIDARPYARNEAGGGATVTIALPLPALALERELDEDDD